MILEIIVIYIVSGLFIGLLSGLFGAGGGLIAVPSLIFIFSLQGFSSQEVMPCVIGTSLGIMVFTSISSIYSHHQLGNIHWPTAKVLIPWIAVSVLVGSAIAKFLPSYIVLSLFCIFMFIAIFKVLNRTNSIVITKPISLPNNHKLISLGIVTGIFSAIIGIGGSIITVPAMRGWKYPMRNAIATAVVCGLPIAFFGMLSYSIMGVLYPIKLPYGSIGDVNWIAIPCVALPSMIIARFGSKLATIIPDQVLRRLYLSLLLVIMIYMLVNTFLSY
jgi:hypothetical protein